MKKPKQSGATRAARLAGLARELRYMDPANIAKDFRGKRERAAIGAVLEWLSLNGACARKTQRFGVYSTTCAPLSVPWTYDAVVLDKAVVDRLEELLK